MIKGLIYEIMKVRKNEILAILANEEFKHLRNPRKAMLTDIYKDDLKTIHRCNAQFLRYFEKFLK